MDSDNQECLAERARKLELENSSLQLILARTEEELRLARETLEERVLERTGELRCSEEKYRRIVETANEGILAMDREHRTFLVNGKMAEMLGYRSDEMIGQTIEHFIFPEEMDDHLSRMGDRRKGDSSSYERRFRRKDGGVCWCSVSATALRDEQGAFAGSFALFSDITERKRAEQALHESESAMRGILEAVTESVLLMDVDGTVAMANKTMAERFGRPADEMAGCCVYDLLSPSVAQGRREQVDKVVRTGRHTTFVDERRERWIENSLYPIFDAQGRVFRLAVFGRDVTDRKLAEESLKKSEALLSVTQGMTKVGGWEWDAVKRTMTWTDEVYRIHDFSRTEYPEAAEALVCRSLACYAPEERDAVEAAFRRCVTLGEPYDMECSFTTAKGRRLWVRTRAHAEWQWGKVVRVIGNIMDITDRKRTEEALRESEERFRGAFQYSAIGMAIISPHGTWVKVNRSVCSIVGYSEDELSTMTFQDITHPDDLDSDLNYVRQMLAGEIETYTMEKRYFHKRGDIVWGLLSVALVRDGAGTPLYFISQIQNITDSKQAETSLKASLAEKEVLLREVHHRVKNNLAAITGLLEMQQKGVTDPAALASFQALSVRIKSMALVHEGLYRSENLSRIDLQEYLFALISHLRTSFGVRSNIRCSVNAADVEMGLELAVPSAMIINELVTNAIKHAFPTGGPGPGSECCEILVMAEADGDDFTLTVADNGVGLPPDLDWTSTASLGLRLVRMLGEHQLGGQLQLHQAEGTRFVLRFTSRRGRYHHGR